MLFERTPLKRRTTQSPHAGERICKYLFGFANLIKWTFETHKVDDSKYSPEIFDVRRISLWCLPLMLFLSGPSAMPTKVQRDAKRYLLLSRLFFFEVLKVCFRRTFSYVWRHCVVSLTQILQCHRIENTDSKTFMQIFFAKISGVHNVQEN